MYRLSTAQLAQSFDRKLQMESVLPDPLEDFKGNFDIETGQVPNGHTMFVDMKGQRQRTLVVTRPVAGGIQGRTVQLGNEVDQAALETLCYANDFSNAITTETYGVDANEKSFYGFLEKVQPQLSLWHGEKRGRYKREALLERYSNNLTVAPQSLTARWNENIYVVNAGTTQPAYNATNTTYEENIGDAMVAAGVTSAATLSVAVLNRLLYWARVTKKIEPMANGRYVLLVPSRQALPLKDPSSSTSIAGVFKDSHVMEAAQNSFNCYLGTWANAFDIFEDPRAPVVDLTGSNGSYALASIYKDAGTSDARTSTSGTVSDVGFILGKGALIEAEYEPLHFKDEDQNYQKIKGIGAFHGCGWTRRVYDDTASPTTTYVQQSSGIFLCASLGVTL